MITYTTGQLPHYNFRMLKYVTQFLNLHDSKMVMETRNLDFVSNQDLH